MDENIDRRPSYSPIARFLYSKDTVRPSVCYRTEREGGDDSSPVIEVEAFGFHDAESLIRNEILPKKGMTYERWIDKNRELHYWHTALNPEIDEKSRRLLRNLFLQFPPGESWRIRNHLRGNLPLLHLGWEDETAMELLQGSEIVIDDDHVFLRGEEEYDLESNYEKKSVYVSLDARHLFPPDIAAQLAGIEVSIGIDFGELRVASILEKLTEQAQSESLTEDSVRLLVNPYMHFVET